MPDTKPESMCDSEVYGKGRRSHPLGKHYYTLIDPDGRMRFFCDSDCLRQQLAKEWAEYVASFGLAP